MNPENLLTSLLNEAWNLLQNKEIRISTGCLKTTHFTHRILASLYSDGEVDDKTDGEADDVRHRLMSQLALFRPPSGAHTLSASLIAPVMETPLSLPLPPPRVQMIATDSKQQQSVTRVRGCECTSMSAPHNCLYVRVKS